MRKSRTVLLDNHDSFTYNLKDYFGKMGVNCEVRLHSQPLKEWMEPFPTSAILSPGPGRPQNAGCLMDFISQTFHKIPLLGICLGHQALGEFFGLRLEKASKPMHGKLSRVYVYQKNDPIFKGIPESFEVVRYHSLILKGESNDIIPLLKTEEGELMAFRHRYLPIYGFQFHPEAWCTEYGFELLYNWSILSGIL